MKNILLVITLLLLAGLAGCGGEEQDATPTSAADTPTAAATDPTTDTPEPDPAPDTKSG